MKNIIKILAALLILALAATYYFFSKSRKEKERGDIAESNFINSEKVVSEYAKELTISNNKYLELYPKYAEQAKKDGIPIKRITSHEKFTGTFVHDTVFVASPYEGIIPSIPDDDYSTDTNVYLFNSNCINADVTTTCPDAVYFRVYGEITINKYNYTEKAHRWFWRGLWFKGKWEPKSKLTSPCGFDIKENTIIKIED